MDDFEKELAAKIKTTARIPSGVTKKNGKPYVPRIRKNGKPAKKPGTKAKVKVASKILPADICQAGKVRAKDIRPKEREAVRMQLVQYYGASKVDKNLLGATKIAEVNIRLCDMRDVMEREIKQAEDDQEDYFKDIDSEYKKLGRPNAPFTWREFDYLCSIACPINEIAGFFDLEPDTLRKKVKAEFGIPWSQYYERRSQGIKIALRRSQIHNAISGDTNMQKFLGINLLGQKNKIDFDGQVQVNSFADLVKNLDNKVHGKPGNIPDNENDDA